MRLAYSALVLVVVLAIAAYALWMEETWVKDWTVEIGGGVLTSLVIIVLIERTLDRQREQERRRVREVALSQLPGPVSVHLQGLRPGTS